MTLTTSPALIVGRPNANMLAQVRALGRRGIPVYCLVHRGEPAFIVKLSRYAKSVIVKKTETDAEVAAAIIHIHERDKVKPVLFFAGDADITLINRIHEQIKDHVVFTTDPARADYLNDKSVQVAVVQQAGIRVPASWCIFSAVDLDQYREALIFPVICRPVELSRRGAVAEKYFIARDWQTLIKWVNKCYTSGSPDILIQEYIEGETETLYVALATCDAAGRVLGIVCGRKRLEFPDGLMCIGETVEHPEFREVCIRSFAGLRIGGVFGIEFKWDAGKGEFVFIEVNLRPGNFLAIAGAAGINLMELAYHQTLSGKAEPAPAGYRRAIWRDLSLVWLSRLYRKEQPQMNTTDAVLVDAWLAADDILPALAWYVVKVWRVAEKFIHRAMLPRR